MGTVRSEFRCFNCKTRMHFRSPNGMCAKCQWTERSLGACPMCDFEVLDGTKHVKLDSDTYHDECYTLFRRYQWALNNPLI